MHAMNEWVIGEGVTKRFGRAVALQDVSFRLAENKIYGLLGRNGAGKTTLLHSITGQLMIDGGTIAIDGHTPLENLAVQRQICFIRDKLEFPKGFTIKQIIQLGTMLYPYWDATIAYRLVDLFELDVQKKVKQLSRGMESAVGIIIGIASRAPLTIFDEPYLGLDAVARERFYDALLEDYEKFPRTIVLSSHLIDEVAKLFEHVLIIDKGKLIIDAEADVLRGMYCRVTGHMNEVEQFTNGKRVLNRQALGTTRSFAVEGPFTEAEIHRAESLGVEIVGLSLQQLLVYLTTYEAEAGDKQ